MDNQTHTSPSRHISKNKVDTYVFESLQGPNMLQWSGKKSFTSTQFYPALLKEQHGTSLHGWMNQIFWGDNLQVMSFLLKEYRGQVDLIYIDPPYDSKADYKKKIKLKTAGGAYPSLSFEEKQYTDIWHNDEYLQFMFERIILMRELLSEHGSIMLHCDYHKSHHLKLILDEIFGPQHFINEIIWHYRTYQGQVKNYYPRKHDTIFWYKKKQRPYFQLSYQNNFQATVDYQRWKSFIVNGNEIRGNHYPKTDSRFDGYLRAWKNKNQQREPTQNDVIMKIKGYVVDDVWMDLQALDPKNKTEKVNYPTQKPEKLLERIIESVTQENDLIFDCFMGSGTTQAVAMRLKRRFIGADINLGAIETSVKRLSQLAHKIHQSTIENVDQNTNNLSKDSSKKRSKQASKKESKHASKKRSKHTSKHVSPHHQYYTGLSIYHVNHYEIFKNPLEAKAILKQIFQIQSLDHTIYDGKKDGRFVKIMPLYRMSTCKDIDEFLDDVQQDQTSVESIEKHKKKNMKEPMKEERFGEEIAKQAIQKVLLMCMGYEDQLLNYVQKDGRARLLDLEIIDLLQHQALWEFKRDTQAHITCKEGRLIITAFHPKYLLNKLSAAKTSVQDWRQLVESVKIDWTYDGSIFKPHILDIPSQNELVKGSYSMPAYAKHIRVKITDLLSESLELNWPDINEPVGYES